MTQKQLDQLHARRLKVVVVGDIMVDHYVISQVDRVSPEAPVPICRVLEDRMVPGGAANVARNLADFGCQVELAGILGNKDEAAQNLLELCEQLQIGTSACVMDNDRPTTLKTRILGNGQQIVRIDREATQPLRKEISAHLVQQCRKTCENADLIIVSDYAKGVLTEDIVNALRPQGSNGPLVAVDPHPRNNQQWDHYSLIKPNLAELKQITGINMDDYHGGDPRFSQEFMLAVDKLQSLWDPEHILITLSASGMYYSHRSGIREWMPTKAVEVFDVSGAGDTSVSFFALALTAGWSPKDSLELATTASGLVVRKSGTASITLDELKSTLES
jgi:D-glycero-beta-D-manno-heptose-7-phosphate kinase